MRQTTRSQAPATDDLATVIAEMIADARRENPSGLKALALLVRQACLMIVAEIERAYGLDSPRHSRRRQGG